MQTSLPHPLRLDPLAMAVATAIGVEAEADDDLSAPASEPDPEPPAALDEALRLQRLIGDCVDAMGTIQARMTRLEEQARRATETYQADRADVRTDASVTRSRLKLDEGRLDQYQSRLASLESAVRRDTTDADAARAEARAWQIRAETGDRRFEQIQERLAAVESAQADRVAVAEAAVADQQRQAEMLKTRAQVSESVVADLESRRHQAEASARDHRSRIACLQAKLSTALEVHRLDDLIRATRHATASTAASRHAEVVEVSSIGHGVPDLIAMIEAAA